MHTSAVHALQEQNRKTAMPASRILLLADDLSGACDAAAAFLRAGHRVRVWIDPASSASRDAEESVQAFHTASRNQDAETAARAVAQAVRRLPLTPGTRIFKKIDSTLRGPIAAELAAIQSALGAPAVLFAPAFPAAGRVIRNGILEVHAATGTLEHHNVRNLFSAALQPVIAIIRHPEDLSTALAAGKSLLLCDAVTQQDLEALARAAQSLPGLLLAGSAGLAAALASLAEHVQPAAPLPHAARTLLVLGTTHAVTLRQLEPLAASHPSGFHPNARLLRIEHQAGDDECIRREFEQYQPHAILLSGGDTALLAARALGAASFTLRGEFAPGVPWGIAHGGLMDQRIVITKSGGFGSPELLCSILKALAASS